MDEKELQMRQMEMRIREITAKIKLKAKNKAKNKAAECVAPIMSIEDLLEKEEEEEAEAEEEQKRMDKIDTAKEFNEYCADLLAKKRKEFSASIEEVKKGIHNDLKLRAEKGEDTQNYISDALDAGVPKSFFEIKDLDRYYTEPLAKDKRSNKSSKMNSDIKLMFDDHTAIKSLGTSILDVPKPLLPSRKLKLEVVVAHYKEALGWLDPFIKHPGVEVSIYSKGGKDVPLPFNFHTHISYLSDVGREVHTYLHHIVNKYDSLQDITLFCQGDPFERFQVGYTPDEFLKEALETTDRTITLFKGQRIEKFDSWNGIDSDEFYLGMNTKARKPAIHTPGEYWMLFMGPLGYELPQSTRFAPGANFAVNIGKIKQYPKSFWIQVLEELFLGPMEDSNPMTSIICERLLPAMIDPINMMVPAAAVDPMDID